MSGLLFSVYTLYYEFSQKTNEMFYETNAMLVLMLLYLEHCFICLHERNAMPSHLCYISIMLHEVGLHNEGNMLKIAKLHEEMIVLYEMSLR